MAYTYGDYVLQTKNLSLSFGNKVILRDVNISEKNVIRDNTPTGQVISVVGKSGIGKTRLLNIIAGLQEPTSGEIYIGLNHEKPQAGKVGMVLQTYPLFEHRSVISNLTLVCSDKERIVFLLNSFEVQDHINKYPCQLSGGQRQRVAIIQQILSSDTFILLDEPFSGLDPVATENLSLLIRQIADLKDENTIMVSTHILEPALAVSDTVIMLGKEPDKEGATVVATFDLVALDLAWRQDIRTDPRFTELCNHVREEFHKY